MKKDNKVLSESIKRATNAFEELFNLAYRRKHIDYMSRLKRRKGIENMEQEG